MSGETGGGHDRVGGERSPFAPNSLMGKKKEHIEQVLAMTGGDFEQAARLLEIRVAELRRLMKKLEIHDT